MLKLLKNMRRQERLMALACLLLVAGQVYFDLKLPDYMTELTKLIKTAGSTTADITSVGLRMLGCTLASALLAIACGFLAARTASGFSFTVRAKLFHHVMDLGTEEMQSLSIPSLITRTTNDITQIQMIRKCAPKNWTSSSRTECSGLKRSFGNFQFVDLKQNTLPDDEELGC